MVAASTGYAPYGFGSCVLDVDDCNRFFWTSVSLTLLTSVSDGFDFVDFCFFDFVSEAFLTIFLEHKVSIWDPSCSLIFKNALLLITVQEVFIRGARVLEFRFNLKWSLGASSIRHANNNLLLR
ncbi:hypothetical protein L2E82_36970 [Cichorium intybus]|uniref:Uncharacterized protein n=1 Tax=Cichorium intybus TaxID=13427 RepID=A0ACB9ACX1_CICIN|nr:hypothetical protein L2E82_36970 [Cichorium intybus]